MSASTLFITLLNSLPICEVITEITGVQGKNLITLFKQVDHHIPTQGTGTRNNERLSGLREKDLANHFNGLTIDRYEVRINVRSSRGAHSSENIFVELDGTYIFK
jgi:hypothetical protein